MKTYVRTRTFVSVVTALLVVIGWLVVETYAARAELRRQSILIEQLRHDLQELRNGDGERGDGAPEPGPR